MDLIAGSVTGKVSEDQYSEINSDAKIVKTFTKEELAEAKGDDGCYTLTFTADADQNCYYRLRGTTVSEVDENGDPLPDPDYSGITDNQTRFDTINDYNYSSMCFYANPIWVNVSEKTVTVDTQVLEKTLELAAAADTEGVVPSVVERFNQIKAEAQDILERAQSGDEEVTQEMVDQSCKNLLGIMRYLSFKQGDKTNLQKVIDVAEEIDLEKYLSEGQEEFTAALDAAKAVMDDADAMQEEVDSAWNELLTAMSQLRFKPSKELLEALIQTAEGMDLTGVDKEVADEFNTALEEAKTVYADSEADEEEVLLAVTSLQNAIAAVEEDLANQGGDTENPDSQGGQDDTNTPGSQDSQNGSGNGTEDPADNSGSQASEPQKAVQTGDSSPILLWAAVLVASAAAIVVFEKKRRKQL